MSQQRRKGFPIVRTSENVSTDTVPFDSLDETKSPSVPTSSGKRKSGDLKPSKSDKKAKTASSKSKGKSRYPVISYDFKDHRNINVNSKSAADQLQQLNKVLSSVCRNEIESLNDYFSTVTSDKSILESLTEVLEQLPASVVNESTDKFSPELSKDEKSSLRSLRGERDELLIFCNKLTELDESPQSLADQYRVGLSTESLTNNSSSSQSVSDFRATLESQLSQYSSLLSTLESRCNQIMGGTDSLSVSIKEAQVAQDNVYNVFNRARIETSSSASNRGHIQTVDPKEAMRQFSAMSKV